MGNTRATEFPVKEISEDLLEALSREFKEPEWMKKRRKFSFNLFNKLKTDELVILAKYTDFRNVELIGLDWFGFLKSDSDHEAILSEMKFNENEVLIVLLDGKPIFVHIPEHHETRGLVLSPLHDVYHLQSREFFGILEKYPEIIGNSRFAAFNQAFHNSGVFLKIPSSMHVENPIRIIHVQKESKVSVVSHHVIIAEQGAEATITEEFYSFHRTELEMKDLSLYSVLTSVEAGPNSNVSFATVQDLNDHVIFFMNRQVFGLRDSNVNWATSFTGSYLLRAKIDYNLNAPGANALDLELHYGSKHQRFQTATFMHHRAEHTQGIIHARMVADEASRVIFNGIGRILENAPFSNSSLDSHGLLLTKSSRIDAFPGLEIENNEVAASHAASASPIDEDQIFYMETRGINPEEAETLIIHGFMEAVIRQIPNGTVRDFFRRLGHMKWERAKYHDESITLGTVVPSLKQGESDVLTLN